MPKRRNKVTITKLESDIMKWTLEQLDSLETEILKLHLHTKLSDSTLADCMGKIDTERYKLNQANGVTTGDELVLPIHDVTNNEVEYCECGKPTLGTSVSRCGTCNKWFKAI